MPSPQITVPALAANAPPTCADAASDGLLRFAAVGQLLAVAADEEQAIIGASSVEHHHGENLADVHQIETGNQRTQGQQLEGHPHRNGDADQRHQCQQGRPVDEQQDYHNQDHGGDGGLVEAVAAELMRSRPMPAWPVVYSAGADRLRPPPAVRGAFSARSTVAFVCRAR